MFKLILIAMRPETIRLRETPEAAPTGAPVIDANFRIVGRKRAAMRVVFWWIGAFFTAAIVGFLIPPVWVAIEGVTAAFAG